MKQGAEHNYEFSLSGKLYLKKIGFLFFELSGFGQTGENYENR
jgi:hypothetical protein